MLLQSPKKRRTDAPPQRATCDTVSHQYLITKGITMKYNAAYFEYYALLSLVWCYDNKLEPMLNCKAECPDWQSEELDIGIEVCRAISKKEGEKNFIINEIFSQELSADDKLILLHKRFPEHKNLLQKSETGVLYAALDMSYEYTSYKIANAISLKLSKLNSNYTQYDNNWLYIFTDFSLFNDDEINELSSIVSSVQKDYALNFHKVFLNCHDKIYIFENNEISSISVDDDTLAKLKKTAILLSKEYRK